MLANNTRPTLLIIMQADVVNFILSFAHKYLYLFFSSKINL